MTATASLERLGLTEGATDTEIEEAHAELVAYLQLAPPALHEWAADELAAADDAYTELITHVAPVSAPKNGHSPAPQNGHATLKLRSRAADFDALGDGGDLLDGHPQAAPTRSDRPQKRASQNQPKPKPAKKATAAAPAAGVTIRLTPAMKKVALAIGGLALLAIVAFAGYQFGNPGLPGITGTPAPSSAAATLDPAQITALMQKITANPNDTDSLQQLADLYYGVGDYQTASTWLNKILAVDPKNISALLGAGAIGYNTSDYATAEKEWRAVLAIDDKDVEAHYDLGFMYFSMNPPKNDLARAEWNTVIALAPGTDIATTVKAHLDQLDAQSSGSPGASPSGGAAAGVPPTPTSAITPTPAVALTPVPSGGSN